MSMALGSGVGLKSSTALTVPALLEEVSAAGVLKRFIQLLDYFCNYILEGKKRKVKNKNHQQQKLAAHGCSY